MIQFANRSKLYKFIIRKLYKSSKDIIDINVKGVFCYCLRCHWGCRKGNITFISRNSSNKCLTHQNGKQFTSWSEGNSRNGPIIRTRPNSKLNSSKIWTNCSSPISSSIKASIPCFVSSDRRRNMANKLLSKLIKLTLLPLLILHLKTVTLLLILGISHYLLCSSVGADENSWFLYPRTKGQVERDLKAKKLPLLSIFRPGVLENRHEPRFGEKLGSLLPFFPKIEAKDAARVMMKTA